MKLSCALRLSNTSCAAFVGAGGKTTALFQAAREISACLVTTTTHIGDWQIASATLHTILSSHQGELIGLGGAGTHLLTGPLEGHRYLGVPVLQLSRLRESGSFPLIPWLIEADGARGRPFKAPAGHEPVIPEFVSDVVVIVGLSGLGKPLSAEFVHRPGIFGQLSGLHPGDTLTKETLVRVLTHPMGGLKSIPANARRIVLLNQADTPALRSQANAIKDDLLRYYDAVLVASLAPPDARQGLVHAVHEPVAGIILAAGGSSRFGSPKQLALYHGEPFVRRVAKTALQADLSPVIVVTGAAAGQVEAALAGVPVRVVFNSDWEQGQSTSIQAGLRAIADDRRLPGAAIFLLADQPQCSPAILRALVEVHARSLGAVIAPEVLGQRANPVLFDRDTFPSFDSLQGDVGGRALFSKYHVTPLPWQDDSLTADIDSPDDLKKLA